MAHVTVNQPVAPGPGNNGGQQIGTSQPLEAANSHRRFRLLGRLRGHLPTLLVMALLGTVGLFGHHSGWKLPKFSALTGNGVAEREDWCEEHGVPQSQCVECRPDLLPRGKDYGWCKEHGVANCPLCHPDVAQVKRRRLSPRQIDSVLHEPWLHLLGWRTTPSARTIAGESNSPPRKR